ncbi:Aminodeoxychorismate synthase component 1 [Corynebacterium kalinowskii]|uniref:aminodeoxychorismate synthase n=1 Tax=Corynebacterium kalinowskii TaxID=2675216 RepID=A0A6B8VV60_9CORY|nr:Aminodeoxychorismate synthase component 1 [Corynebacterium kalinowskii]
MGYPKVTKILLIDNHDSFTHLLGDLIYRAVGIMPEIVPNDIPLPKADLYILSPGPGHPGNPADIGSCADALAGSAPVIGVCLGHQAIALDAGCQVTRAQHPRHGLASNVHHDGTGIFQGIPSPFEVIRYHSLEVTEPTNIEVLARADDGTVMALRRVDKPQWGVQFHPESIGSAHGEQLMRQLVDATGVLPIWHRRRAPLVNLADLVATWRAEFPYVTWLDTATDDGMHLVGAGHRLVSPHQIPHGVLAADSDPAPVDFVPGALGVLPYEASGGRDGGEFVAGELLAPEVVYQVCGDEAWLISQDNRELPTLRSAPSPVAVSASIALRHNRAEYAELIAQCQEAIAAGDSYELCLTTSASAECEADSLALYLRLREVAPSPMAGLFLGPVNVLSASPERFLQIRQRLISASPIKGTRPRGDSAAEDERLRAELSHSTKDRAENLMIVDLLRNDLARSCVPGSLRVPELCAVHTFSRAHQMISTITGDLAPGVGSVDAIQAAFPGGSMTGAPKQRSMDILADLEGTDRGFYSGCMGYISATGDADFSILIRTVVQEGQHLSYGAGGAITALSDPDEEYDEVLVKITPFRLLLEQP